jgi:hypothetical protein
MPDHAAVPVAPDAMPFEIFELVAAGSTHFQVAAVAGRACELAEVPVFGGVQATLGPIAHVFSCEEGCREAEESDVLG